MEQLEQRSPAWTDLQTRYLPVSAAAAVIETVALAIECETHQSPPRLAYRREVDSLRGPHCQQPLRPLVVESDVSHREAAASQSRHLQDDL